MSELKKRVRKTKKDMFYNEQLQIVEKINKILNINENNNTFILDQLNNDLEKQKEILNLVDEIKKYFKYNTWTFFKGVDNKWLSLVRSVYKNTGYILMYKQVRNSSGNYIIYYVNKKI
jgi:hypothetical protein